MSNTCDIGMIGLAVMGSNLARNIASRGYQVAVYNRTSSVTEQFIKDFGTESFTASQSLAEFVKSIKRPRKIIIMVQAGAATDAVISSLLEILDEQDIIIDGGNAWFEDTQRREKLCQDKNVNFIGMGISGGEEGALKGPSMMPGGPISAWQQISEIMQKIAAQVDNQPCVTYIGPDGAGHFVKMVHNGIEYADMQLIAESYHVLSSVGGFSAAELAGVFSDWNNGPLASFLIEITAEIFQKIDPETSKPLVEVVLDKAGQKGTGRWTSTLALELGVAAPSIAAAVDARVLSSLKNERQKAASILDDVEKIHPITSDKNELLKTVGDGLYAAKIIAYAQGLEIMQAASLKYNWDLKLDQIASIWRGGCIIRAKLLSQISQAYKASSEPLNLMLFASIAQALKENLPGLRQSVAVAALNGVPTPAMSASLSYFDSYRSANLPQNLTQAQRDYFGAHTYERKDMPGVFHSSWAP